MATPTTNVIPFEQVFQNMYGGQGGGIGNLNVFGQQAAGNIPQAELASQGDEISRQLAALEKYKTESVSDFPSAYQKYSELLSPLSADYQPSSIYDLASQLSRGLTAQMQSGRPASIGAGLAMGFNSFTEAQKAKEAGQRQRFESMRMQAAQLAIQDVQKGEELYNSMLSSIILRDPTKLGNVVHYIKHDEEGNPVATVPVYEKDLPAIQKLTDEGYSPVPPDSAINFNIGPEGGPAEVENTVIKAINQRALDHTALADQAVANEGNLQKFRILMENMGPENFGVWQNLAGTVKELAVSLPVFSAWAEGKGWDSDVEARQAMKNVQIGFVMDIVSGYKGAISNRELDTFQQSVASQANEYEANNFILVTSSRANQIARDYDSAYNEKWAEVYSRWTDNEINAVEAQNEMSKFDSEWLEDERSQLFTDEVLEAVGMERADLPAGDERFAAGTFSKQTKNQYIQNLMDEHGIDRTQAEIIAAGLSGKDSYSQFHLDFRDNFNEQLSGGAIRVP